MCMAMTVVRDKTKKDPYMCATLINMFKRGELRKDHPLQRKPDQWTTEARNGFVVTVIKHEDVDSIKICEQINGQTVILWLIDGIQRLTTIEKYRKNLFSLGKNIEFPIVYYQVAREDNDGNLVKDNDGNLVYNTVEFDLRNKYYRDLPEELKEKFDNFPIDVVKHLDCSDEEIGYHIRRYNRQTSMNANQNTITYMDSIAKYVKAISENNRFFADCGNYRESEKKKNVIDRVVTESIMAIYHLDNWKKGKSMGAYLNKESSKCEFDTYNEELGRLSKIIDQDTTGKLFNSKNSFIWFALFHKFVDLNIEDRKFADFLDAFISELHGKKMSEADNKSFDELESNRATKDKRNIIEKINLLTLLMKDFLHTYDKSMGDGISTEEFISVNVGIDINDVIADMDFYNQSLDELLDITVRIESKLRHHENRLSLLGLMAYSYKEDVDLEEWLGRYSKSTNTYLADQKKNYIHMRDSLNKYLKQSVSIA